MEKRLVLHLSGQDVYVNVVGGMHIDEPAIDLGIVAAVTSSLREVPIEPGLLVLGEVGLGGEVRAISQAEMRIVKRQRWDSNAVCCRNGTWPSWSPSMGSN